MTSVVARLAARAGLTEGETYTSAIGLVVGLACAIGGIPPTLADRPAATHGRPSFDPLGNVAPAPAAEVAPPDLTVPSTSTDLLQTDAFGLPADPPLDGGSGFGRGGAGATGPTPSNVAVDRPSVGRLRPVGTIDRFAAVPAPGAPEGVTADETAVFVSTNNGSGRGQNGRPVVLRYSPAGALEATVVLDQVEPGFGVSGLAQPRSRSSSVVYAVATRPAVVLRVDTATGSVTTYATIPNARTCVATALSEPCELGPTDNAPDPRTGVFGVDGSLYVTDRAQGIVWRVAPGGAEVEVAHRAPEFLSADGLNGITFDSHERLVVTVGQSVQDAGAGAVFRLTDRVEKVATMGRDSRPVGIVGGRSGRLYVALAGAGRVAVLALDGSRQDLPPAAQPAFEAPVGLAYQGSDLLVTVQSPTRLQGAQVARVATDDQGLLG